METRDVLLKADKVTVTFERLEDGKIRVTTTSWDDAENAADAKRIWRGMVEI